QDHSYMKRYLNYQAQLQNKTMDELTNDIYRNLDTQLQAKGFTIENQYAKPLQDFLKTQDRLTLIIRPAQPMNIQTVESLHLYKPNDIPKILNAKLSSQ